MSAFERAISEGKARDEEAVKTFRGIFFIVMGMFTFSMLVGLYEIFFTK